MGDACEGIHPVRLSTNVTTRPTGWHREHCGPEVDRSPAPRHRLARPEAGADRRSRFTRLPACGRAESIPGRHREPAHRPRGLLTVGEREVLDVASGERIAMKWLFLTSVTLPSQSRFSLVKVRAIVPHRPGRRSAISPPPTHSPAEVGPVDHVELCGVPAPLWRVYIKMGGQCLRREIDSTAQVDPHSSRFMWTSVQLIRRTQQVEIGIDAQQRRIATA